MTALPSLRVLFFTVPPCLVSTPQQGPGCEASEHLQSCPLCSGRSRHTLTEPLLWLLSRVSVPPEVPDTDLSPAWVPTCPPGPGSAPQRPSFLSRRRQALSTPISPPLHSTPRPHLLAYLHLTLHRQLSLPVHFRFKRHLTSTLRSHLHITSSTSPPPPHPELTSHNNQALDGRPKALHHGSLLGLASQHRVNIPPSRAMLSSISQLLPCSAPARGP